MKLRNKLTKEILNIAITVSYNEETINERLGRYRSIRKAPSITGALEKLIES